MGSVRNVCVAFVLLICSGSFCFTFAQFSGSAGLGMATYRNAEGTDTSSSDRALSPELQLDYTIKLSPLATIKPEVSFQYDLYLEKSERSYYTLSPEITYRLYLSNQEAIREEAKQTIAPTLSDTSYEAIAATLTALSDSTLNLHTGVERTALKAEAIADIQSDIAATLLAYVGLLEEMGLTQSFKEVLIEELATIKDRVALLGVPKNELSRYFKSIETVITILNRAIAAADYDLSPSSSNDDVLPGEGQAQPPSLITLIQTGSGLEHFSSSQFYPKLYLGDVSATTYASRLSLPLSYDHKQYRATYDAYTYSTIRIQPRLDIYPSNTTGLGFDYHFERSYFPSSDLYTFNEHELRIDSRFELSDILGLVAEAGIGRRSYPNPMSISLGGGNRRTYTAPNNYLRLALGAALITFPSDKISLGVAGRFTSRPTDAIYLGGITSKHITTSSYFGLASDESYIYEAMTLSAAMTAMLPLDIELSADISREHRAYPPPPTIPGPKFSTRADNAWWLGGSLSKYFILSRQAVGFIESIYPRLSLTYTDLASNLDAFSYSDLSLSAFISIGF